MSQVTSQLQLAQSMVNRNLLMLKVAFLACVILVLTACAKPVTISMVSVKGGCFAMGETLGDESHLSKRGHKVCVDDFRIGTYEITQGQWQTVMGEPPPIVQQCGVSCPVVSVSWEDVQLFLTRLNSATNELYRLPTEAEWEYAARSGGKLERWSGTNDAARLSDYSWYGEGAGTRAMPHPVGTKKPNGLGLYDMSGNAPEWTADRETYDEAPHPEQEPPSSSSMRVIRGGGWFFDADNVTTTARDRLTQGARYNIGFRVVLPALRN